MKTLSATSYSTAILIVLFWVIPVTSVHAKLTETQCLDKLSAFTKSLQVFKNGYWQNDKPAENNYRYNAFAMKQYSGECAHFPYSKNSFIVHKDRLQEQIEICIKHDLGPTCGQPAVNIEYPASTPATDSRSQQTESNNDSPPTRKLSAAEQRRQDAQQKALDQINQSQQLAQENQSKADAARQGKRKVHDPAAEAHHCIKVNTGGSTGSMVNTCNFKISYVDCRYNNTSDELKNWLTCEKQKFGFGFIDAHNEDLTFTRKVQKIYWFACKEPSRPVDYNFVEGRGISGRCHDTANSD